MNSQNLQRATINLAIITVIFFIAASVYGQDKRFGISDSTSESQANNPRRYLPSEFGYRYGVVAEQSELETAPTPVQKQQTLVNKAAQQLAQGQVTRAIDTYRQAIAAKQQLEAAYLGLGCALLKTGQYQEATQQFQAVLDRDPNSSQAQLNIGVAFFCTDQSDAAISHYQRAIELRKGVFPQAHFNLALVFFHRGQYKQAIDNYQAAIKVNRNYPAAYNNLGLAYEADGDIELAAKNYQLALTQKRGNYPLARYNLARCYFNQGKIFPTAVAELNTALKQQHNFPEAYLILGNSYLVEQLKAGNGAVDKAINFYQQAIELRPDYALAHENLANAYAIAGKKSAAFIEYRRAFKLYKKYSPLLLDNIVSALANRESFYINDEFSRAEGPGRLKPDRNQTKDYNEIVVSVLNEYENLSDELKTSPDIHYCFGRAYLSIGDWRAASDEFAAAMELSNGQDTESASLYRAIYKMIY